MLPNALYDQTFVPRSTNFLNSWRSTTPSLFLSSRLDSLWRYIGAMFRTFRIVCILIFCSPGGEPLSKKGCSSILLLDDHPFVDKYGVGCCVGSKLGICGPRQGQKTMHLSELTVEFVVIKNGNILELTNVFGSHADGAN